MSGHKGLSVPHMDMPQVGHQLGGSEQAKPGIILLYYTQCLNSLRACPAPLTRKGRRSLGRVLGAISRSSRIASRGARHK